MTSHQESTGWADELLDDLLPEDFDWRDKVRHYPRVALLVAAGIGVALGRSHGSLLTSAVSRFTVDRVAHNISDVLDPGGRTDED